MADPIIFKITEAGKFASLSASEDSAKLKVNLTTVAVGTGRYVVTGNETGLQNKIKESDIVSGDVEPESNTLRFSASMAANAITPIYEVGLFTDDGVLFAVASSTTEPLLSLYPNVVFVMAFGLSLNDIEAKNVTVTTDPSGAMAVVIMQQHLAAPDPHPQYLTKSRFQLLLRAAFPFGYKYWSSEPTDPAPLFDELMGLKTYWRRLEGVQLVSVRDGDPVIGESGLVVGNGGLEKTDNTKPKQYTHYTSYCWERYDPDAPIRHNGISTRNNIHKFK